MKQSPLPQKIYLKDYQAPGFSVEELELHFILNEDVTRVRSALQLKHGGAESDLWLDGEDLKLVSVHANGTVPRYELTDSGMRIFSLPENCRLEIETEIKPQENTALEGLYKSNGVFCTQCEAQ